jgi:hypothetical protein
MAKWRSWRDSLGRLILLRPAERGEKLVWRDTGLLQDSGQRAELQLAVIGDDAAHGTASHDDVAPALPHDRKAEPFQRAYDFRA